MSRKILFLDRDGCSWKSRAIASSIATKNWR